MSRSLPVSLGGTQHAWLAVLGIGAQGFSWILISGGIRQIPGHHGAMLLLTQPVSSLVLAWWILDQELSFARLAGAGVILLGIALPLLRETRRQTGS